MSAAVWAILPLAAAVLLTWAFPVMNHAQASDELARDRDLRALREAQERETEAVLYPVRDVVGVPRSGLSTADLEHWFSMPSPRGPNR